MLGVDNRDAHRMLMAVVTAAFRDGYQKGQLLSFRSGYATGVRYTQQLFVMREPTTVKMGEKDVAGELE